MSFSEVPPEIMAHIFDNIGSSWFHSDVSRLTICKWWSVYALEVFWRDLTIKGGTLKRWRSSTLKEPSLSLIGEKIRKNTRVLRFDFFCEASRSDRPTETVLSTREEYMRRRERVQSRLYGFQKCSKPFPNSAVCTSEFGRGLQITRAPAAYDICCQLLTAST
jgi:hypothetical protein